MWYRAIKRPQDLRKSRMSEFLENAELDAAFHCRNRQCCNGIIVKSQHLMCVANQRGARWGEPDLATARTVKECNPRVCLEAFDLKTDGGLAAPQDLGGA